MTVVLDDLLDELGPSALRLVAGSIVASTPITGISFYDPVDVAEVWESTLLLCPGVSGTAALGELMGRVGGRNVAAVVVRDVSTAPRGAIREAAEHGVAVFELATERSWNHLIAAVHHMLGGETLARNEVVKPEGVDMFRLANAVAHLVDAPVTIENLGSKIIAFSGDQGRADEARKSTVLALQVSPCDTEFLRSEGYFTRIYASDEVVHVPTEGVGGTMPRAVIRLHYQGHTLGSIWAATDAGDSPEFRDAMTRAAAMVAPHVAERAALGRAAQAATAAQVLALMRGGTVAREAAFRLGAAESKWIVVAIASRERANVDRTMREAALVFGSHLQATFVNARTALVDGCLYGVVPLSRGGDAIVISTVRAFIDKWSVQALVAIIGDRVDNAAGLAESRRSADRALRAFLLQHTSPTPASPSLVRADELRDAVMIQQFTDLMVTERVHPTGALARLMDYDASHDSDLVRSVAAWLDAFGDVQVAATTMHVHANTFRYRLRRIGEIGQVDLGDTDSRFSLMLQLRVFRDDIARM